MLRVANALRNTSGCRISLFGRNCIRSGNPSELPKNPNIVTLLKQNKATLNNLKQKFVNRREY